jgi:predicted SnoaL-like aldol condensation-catalyzing enzyme
MAGLRLICAWALACCGLAEAHASASTAHAELTMTGRERANVHRVLDWWRLVIESGHLEYVDAYQSAGYIQHDPNITTGRQGFIDAFSQGNTPAEPIPTQLSEDVPFAAGRGSFVWLMRESVVADDTAAGKTIYRDGFDLLRLEHGLIQEHWDVGKRHTGASAVIYGHSRKSPSRYPTGKLTLRERSAQHTAMEAAEAVYVRHDATAMKRWFDPDYIEHYQKLSDRTTFASDLAAAEPASSLRSARPVLTLVNGEYVLMMWEASSPDPQQAGRVYPWFLFHLLRIKDSKVVEHWQSS